jgi:hypothetical protein
MTLSDTALTTSSHTVTSGITSSTTAVCPADPDPLRTRLARGTTYCIFSLRTHAVALSGRDAVSLHPHFSGTGGDPLACTRGNTGKPHLQTR